jgi:hypothetical protein
MECKSNNNVGGVMYEIVTWLGSTITCKLSVYISAVARVYMGNVAS